MSSIPKILITLANGEVRKYSLQMESVRIGRAADNTVVLDDPGLSAHHAVLHQRDEGFEIIDLGSTNGIEFEGKRIMTRILHHGDKIQIGEASLEYFAPPEQAETLASDAKESVDSVVPAAPAEPATDVEEEVLDRDGSPKAVPLLKTATAPRTQPVLDSAQGGGFLASAMLFLLTLLAPVVGLHIRHYQETGGGILIMDVLSARGNAEPAGQGDARPSDDPPPAEGVEEGP